MQFEPMPINMGQVFGHKLAAEQWAVFLFSTYIQQNNTAVFCLSFVRYFQKQPFQKNCWCLVYV